MTKTNIPERISDYVMHKSQPASVAVLRIAVAQIYRIILVVDDDETLFGVISKSDCTRYYHHYSNTAECNNLKCADICTRNFCCLTTNQDKYLHGRSLFAEHNFWEIPIVDDNNVPQDIFGRFQAFFLDFFNRGLLPKNHYALCIINAVRDATIYGYDRISVIEFGVSSGNGLFAAEILCAECEKLYGIGIDLFGFDSGIGLYDTRDKRDLPNAFGVSWFQDDMCGIRKRLRKAKIVLGDICDTAKMFLSTSSPPPPIGAVFIDVDHYTPTAAILEMFEQSDKFFLPEVYMYFDDLYLSKHINSVNKLTHYYEGQGEWLAVKEFNARNNNLKICPEGLANEPISAQSNIKICVRLSHPKFGKFQRFPLSVLPLRN